MKRCTACDVTVATPATACPLCGTPLVGEGAGAAAYPPASGRKGYHFAKRLLLFLSVMTAVVCVVVNILATPNFWWCLFVVTALAYLWAVIPHALRRGGNGGGKALMQVVCGSALAVVLDWEIGWRGWSINFAVPILFCAGIIAVMILIACNRTNWAGYVLYQVVLAVLGFVPPILYFTGVSTAMIPALIPGFLALSSLVGLAVFGDRSIKSEFRRRLHF